MRGFTLIEILIYSAIFTMVLGAILMFTWTIVATSDSVRNTIELGDNTKFLQQKLTWLVTGAASITTPVANATSSTLVITKGGTTYTVDQALGVVRLQSGFASPIPLTNDFVTVTSLTFTTYAFSPNTKNTVRVQAGLANFSKPVAATTTLDFYASIQ